MFLKKLFRPKEGGTAATGLVKVQAMIADSAPDTTQADIERMQGSAKKRFRMLDAGISRYRWSTCNDEKVCTCCSSMAKKELRIDTSADKRYPGEFICDHGKVCRCTMSPLFKGADY